MHAPILCQYKWYAVLIGKMSTPSPPLISVLSNVESLSNESILYVMEMRYNQYICILRLLIICQLICLGLSSSSQTVCFIALSTCCMKSTYVVHMLIGEHLKSYCRASAYINGSCLSKFMATLYSLDFGYALSLRTLHICILAYFALSHTSNS